MTYEELLAALEAYTEDSEDLADQLPGIISRAEIRISKDLNIDAMNEIATQPVLQGSYWISKPDDWIATLQFVLVDGTTRILLENTTESMIDDYYRDRTVTDVPRFYANWDESWFLIAPALDKAYTAELKYEARIAGLAPSVDTWIATNHPDLILNACLAGSTIFHKSPQNRELYEAEYAGVLKSTQDEVVRQRSDATNTRRKGR